jgi:aminodeoxyfutalosine synthase
MHAAEAPSPVRLTRDRLVELIRESGCVPVERDALYQTLHIYDDACRAGAVS